MTERARSAVRGAALIGPAVLAGLAGLVRDLVANTSAALVLVLVVVAVGAVGDRVAGVLAALSAAVSFDFFLTEPYYRFAIFARDDIETAVLLLAIGLAVTEIALWGRRQHEQASRRAGYLSGVGRAARLAADGVPSREETDTVARMIGDVLDLDDCRFVNTSEPRESARPVLRSDGTVAWNGHTVDVRREGLPVMDVIELPAGRRGEAGRFELTASTTVRRPDKEQLLVAATLAEQVSTARNEKESGRHGGPASR